MATPPSLPTLVGLSWSRHKSPSFKTRVASHVSGREVRLALYTYPLYEFEAVYKGGLPSANKYPGPLGASDQQTLMGFFLQMQGQYATFLYSDPDDNTVTGQAIGTGNGSTTAFVMGRTLGGFNEPCSWVTSISKVYLNGVSQSSGSYSLTTPNTLIFNSAPGSGVAITADFSYAFQCRFLDDKMDFEEFMWALWKADSVKFRSVTVNTVPA